MWDSSWDISAVVSAELLSKQCKEIWLWDVLKTKPESTMCQILLELGKLYDLSETNG